MPKYARLPAFSGKRLVKLLQKDGWIIHRQAKHGVSLTKRFPDRTRVTVVPSGNAILDDGTLSAILSPKQTSIGKSGLLKLVNEYGI